MPRPVWSGAISFGLVTIPIKVLPATENHSISFRQYHLEDMSRVRTRKVCEIDGKQLTNAEIGKGYEVSKDTIVAVTDAELEEMPLPTAKAIEIAAFVRYESVDPVRIGEGYYLQADGQVAAKPYTLLRKALERNSKAAVAKFAWHGRERLGLLRVQDGVIVLHAMKWDDEVRDPQELAPKAVEVSDEEIDRAVLLIDSMTTDDITGHEWSTDRYTQALEQVIRAKAGGKKPPKPAEEKAPAGQVLDLMAALQESVSKAQASRGESGGSGKDATVHEMPKKRAAKKTTGKKTAGKKTTAKKTTAGKKTTAKKRGA
ncbi:non-homologous end joining protein Ku [Streptomyces longisporoflavus]|uniref:non-homologous end joining protein Ku n=1 Tax=Streptomyces longisporoflavus TaxID=28044 RepID=UPI00167CDEC8|nr:Ku protein [Streptomyces longisporoflavus]GGV24317.1 non-homologous end joining protein Ku [Streptomyces longisporoflavus]